MDLPIKFPSETEVILEDVARFRALSPAERIQAIQSLLASGRHLMRISPKAAWAKEYAAEQKRLERHNIREFLARHGYGSTDGIRLQAQHQPTPDTSPE